MASCKSVVGVLVFLIAAALSSPFASPGGGGGIEYYANIRVAPLTSAGLPTGGLFDMPVGTVYGIGGFGYAIDHNGWKIGGFGKALFTHGLDLPIPATMWKVTNAIGGIGGLISGGHGRLGPIDLSINSRLGVGGIAVTEQLSDGRLASSGWTTGIVVLYGAIDGEAGLSTFPSMMVSIFGGVEALLPMPFVESLFLIPTPVVGMRLTWGRL